MERLELLQEHLKEPGPVVWSEPFYEAWLAGEGLSRQIRFAQSQAAEMAAAKPFIKPGELIVGNNALRSIITGVSSPFGTGMRFQGHYVAERLRDEPGSQSAITEMESYWSKWQSEGGQYTPMTCHASLAYEIPLTLGLDGMRDHVRHWRRINVSTRPDCAEWYDALLVILDGISAFIGAHAAAAEEAAIAATSPERRMELERMAAACHRIAHESPASFHEATQLFYLIFYLCGHDSPGPIDRYLYPSLKQDMDAGSLSREEAQEILDCLWLKFEEKTAYGATIGGQLRNGSDASNELSLMCVESIRRLRLLSPRTAMRWHPGISQKLMDATCKAIAEGATFPALVNDTAIIPGMLERGISLEDAREYTFVGCGQTYPHGRGHGNYEDVVINSVKPLELALNDGIDPMTGDRMGPATGEAETFDSYEAFEQAYRQQMNHHISGRIQSVNRRREATREHVHDFLRSLLTHSCVERGLDWHSGGADYSEGMVDMVGLPTVTDSLMAIKRGVYEEGKVSLRELVDTLNRNWDGAEELRLYFLHKAPKFGNDLDAMDEFTVQEFSPYGSVETHGGCGNWLASCV